ncbi:Calcium uptake protein 3, mitochondrial [Varanus komodoensis]|nr:Calcium uptake protein 3, mitochondrial [Varanus komodoensis]
MAALRGLLGWRRCRFSRGGRPDLPNRRQLWSVRAAEAGGDGASRGLSAAAAGAAGGALAWFFCQHFYERPRQRELAERRPPTLAGSRGGGGGGAGEPGRGLLPIPVAAAAKETTFTESRPGYEDLDLYATSREQRFRMFASLEFEGQLFMTPYDFIQSVTNDEPRRAKQWKCLSKQELNQILLETPPVWKGSSKLFRNLQEKGVISYTEYLFLLCILTKPHAGFRIAFNMFDTDGNEMVDKKEFLVLPNLFLLFLDSSYHSLAFLSYSNAVVHSDISAIGDLMYISQVMLEEIDQVNLIPCRFTQLTTTIVELSSLYSLVSVLQDIFRKKNEKKERRGDEEKRAMLGMFCIFCVNIHCVPSTPVTTDLDKVQRRATKMIRELKQVVTTTGTVQLRKKAKVACLYSPVAEELGQKEVLQPSCLRKPEERKMKSHKAFSFFHKDVKVLKTEGEDLVPRSYWDTLRRSTSQALFSDLAERADDITNLLSDTTLLVHFFGKKGKAELNFEDFYRFMDNLQTEVLEIEFLSYSNGMNTISEEDFAHILLRYTNVENTSSYLENVRCSIPEEQGITFDEFRSFFQFLNNLEDFAIAMQMYNFANRSIGQDEFKRAVYVATGLKLSPHLVNTVFKIFDVDKDDQLSYKEFIGIMKDRLHRGFRGYKSIQKYTTFKSCVKKELNSR